ncbi:uncharacterized protein LOC129752909 [Uranotaenia lowii]|uniref:uncharacterized protein LOC129752909 n=1 Tax=Uranotaenia lowii TaxID=190385 RepID=UPI00247A6299|nr:uncharacterized protein LOC129752909 [Uranotaenia lowii]
MAEKEAIRYRYDSYTPLMKQSSNNGMSTLQRSEMSTALKNGTQTSTTIAISAKKAPSKSGCCSCQNQKSSAFWAALLTNLGICTLLFGYTLLGSFIFLAIEGGASQMQQRMLASTNRQLKPLSARSDSNLTLSQQLLHEALEARQRTVENIWDITVSLNILYRENWTRLASLEIARFQEQLIKRLTEEMASQLDNMSPAASAVMVPQPLLYDYEWTFSRSFFYSLTVLSTIVPHFLRELTSAIPPTAAAASARILSFGSSVRSGRIWKNSVVVRFRYPGSPFRTVQISLAVTREVLSQSSLHQIRQSVPRFFPPVPRSVTLLSNAPSDKIVSTAPAGIALKRIRTTPVEYSQRGEVSGKLQRTTHINEPTTNISFGEPVGGCVQHFLQHRSRLGPLGK